MADDVRLIDANKLLEDIEDAIDIENDGEDVEKSKFIILGLKIAKKYINKAATVKAQTVKHGHWEYRGRDTDGRLIYKCTECGYTLSVAPEMNLAMSHEKFCYSCGARMGGGSE